MNRWRGTSERREALAMGIVTEVWDADGGDAFKEKVIEYAAKFARQHGVVTVDKGAMTSIRAGRVLRHQPKARTAETRPSR